MKMIRAVDRNCKKYQHKGHHFETGGEITKFLTHTSLRLWTKYVDSKCHYNRETHTLRRTAECSSQNKVLALLG